MSHPKGDCSRGMCLEPRSRVSLVGGGAAQSDVWLEPLSNAQGTANDPVNLIDAITVQYHLCPLQLLFTHRLAREGVVHPGHWKLDIGDTPQTAETPQI